MARITLDNPFVLGKARLCCRNKLAINSWEMNTRVYFSLIYFVISIQCLSWVTTFCAATEVRLFWFYDITSQGLASESPQQGRGRCGQLTPAPLCLKPEVTQVSPTRSLLARIRHVAPPDHGGGQGCRDA